VANRKPEQKKHTISSLSLSPATNDILDRLTQDATDYIGRTISGSAIVRALLTYADQQGYQWTLSTLAPLIETEIQSGTMWGKKK
jgi:hypothetical protein